MTSDPGESRFQRFGGALTLWLWVGWLAIEMSGCRRTRATEAECHQILDRLVALELAERGFHDPVLRERKTHELQDMAPNAVATCVGRPLPPGAASCAAGASTAEDVVHRCLR